MASPRGGARPRARVLRDVLPRRRRGPEGATGRVPGHRDLPLPAPGSFGDVHRPPGHQPELGTARALPADRPTPRPPAPRPLLGRDQGPPGGCRAPRLVPGTPPDRGTPAARGGGRRGVLRPRR